MEAKIRETQQSILKEVENALKLVAKKLLCPDVEIQREMEELKKANQYIRSYIVSEQKLNVEALKDQLAELRCQEVKKRDTILELQNRLKLNDDKLLEGEALIRETKYYEMEELKKENQIF